MGKLQEWWGFGVLFLTVERGLYGVLSLRAECLVTSVPLGLWMYMQYQYGTRYKCKKFSCVGYARWNHLGIRPCWPGPGSPRPPGNGSALIFWPKLLTGSSISLNSGAQKLHYTRSKLHCGYQICLTSLSRPLNFGTAYPSYWTF